MTDIVGNPLAPVENGKLTFASASGRVDSAGNLFAAYIRYDANGNRVVVKKYNSGGTVVGDWTVICPFAHKLDSFSIFPSGANLMVLMTGHGPTNEATGFRDVSESIAVIPNVFSAPETADGGPGAYAGGVVTPPAPSNYPTAAENAEAVAQRFGENGNIRLALLNKTKQGISEEKVLTENNFYSSDKVYSRLDQTIYGTTLKLLRDVGLITPAQHDKVVAEVQKAILEGVQASDAEPVDA